MENTIKRHNEFAATGIDLDFGKGDLELNRFNGDPDNRPNPCLRSIESAPYVAICLLYTSPSPRYRQKSA